VEAVRSEQSADVIVVGGGPAGASTAWALARNGVDVLLLDRARFPRPKPCAEYLSPQASRILADMGALEGIERAGAAQLAGMTVRAPNGVAFEGRFAAAHGFRGFRDRGLALRRETLDAIVLDRARAAGARVAEGVAVRDLLRDAHRRVCGVRASDGERERALAARVVVGADGLRRELGAVGIGVRAAAELPGTRPPARAAADGVDPGAMTEYLTHLGDLPPIPDAVIVGLDLHLTYAKLAEAQRCILGGAEFICTTRDHAYPVEGRLLPGAGATVAALEVATGKRALCIGKPEPYLFAEAIRWAGPEAGKVVVVGDSPDYDIVAAHRVGATGVLITTGLTDAAVAAGAKGEATPDHVIHSLDELFSLPELAGA